MKSDRVFWSQDQALGTRNKTHAGQVVVGAAENYSRPSKVEFSWSNLRKDVDGLGSSETRIAV